MNSNLTMNNNDNPIKFTDHETNNININNENKNNKFKRFIIDTSSAIMASACVSPFVSIIDKAIFQNGSGATTLGNSLKNSIKSIISSPIKFSKSPEFNWVFFLHSMTYSSANIMDTFSKANKLDTDIPKFFVVSCVNIVCCMLKDRAFVRLFGTKTPGKVPKLTLTCFGIRDSLTVLCSFILPKKLSLYMQLKGFRKKYSDTFAQLICPCFIQIFSTPVHLLGVDVYNNSDNNFSKRLEFIKREYFKTTCARMSRIFPAFGIGGICNRTYKSYFIDKFEKN